MKLFFLFLFIGIGFSSHAQISNPTYNPSEVPKGWVVVGKGEHATCGTGGPNEVRIRKIDDLPSGTIMEICIQPIPEGWVLVRKQFCLECGYTSDNCYVIKKK